MTETYYDVLGVAPDASTDEIEAAYRERLKETHPDVSDDADASDRTKTLIEAKEVLTDDAERTRYDRLGHDQYVATDGTPAQQATPGTAPKTEDESVRSDPTAPGEQTTETDTTTDQQGSRTTAKAPGADSRRQRRHNQQAPRDTWRSGEGQPSGTDETTWRAWDTDGAYTVREGESMPLYSQLLRDGQSLVLLAAAFVFYPLLLWAALFPGFPLAVNATVGGCLLALVAYLQSLPAVGLVVYGVWTLLLPFGIVGLGIDLWTPLAGIALVVTALSFGFTLLTRAAMEW